MTREENRIKCAKYRARNRSYYNETRAAYYHTVLKKNPESRLRKALRDRLRGCLSAVRVNKPVEWAKNLLGCEIAYFRRHLEDQFSVDMTWDNYGKVWCIDHKRPIISFDLSKIDQQKRCFHFSNLQPLTVKDNLLKGAKYGEWFPPRRLRIDYSS